MDQKKQGGGRSSPRIYVGKSIAWHRGRARKIQAVDGYSKACYSTPVKEKISKLLSAKKREREAGGC